MTVLITGAGGFLGGHLVKTLLDGVDRGEKVRAVDSRPFSEWKQLHPRADNMRLDLVTRRACDVAVQGRDVIYHLAADTGGMEYIASHRAATMLNAVIDANMVQAARDAAVERFYFASSSCVYPVSRQQSHVPAVLAEDWVWPADPEPGYGLSKLHTEQLCLFAAQEWGLTVRIGRHQSVYGPKGWMDGGREKVPGAICRKIAQAKLAGSHEIGLWGDGTQARDFVYVSDAVACILGITASNYGQPLNLGTGTATTVAELVAITSEIAGWPVTVRRLDGPAGVEGVQARSTDTTLVAAHAAWKPEVSLRDGMARTWEWVFEQVAARA